MALKVNEENYANVIMALDLKHSLKLHIHDAVKVYFENTRPPIVSRSEFQQINKFISWVEIGGDMFRLGKFGVYMKLVKIA